MTLNIHGVIDFCCGAPRPEELSYNQKKEMLSTSFKKFGMKPLKPDSIQKWLERGQIPGDRLVELHILSAKMGRRLDLNEFIPMDSADKVTALFG